MLPAIRAPTEQYERDPAKLREARQARYLVITPAIATLPSCARHGRHRPCQAARGAAGTLPSFHPYHSDPAKLREARQTRYLVITPAKLHEARQAGEAGGYHRSGYQLWTYRYREQAFDAGALLQGMAAL
eukprot:scaffold35382_cov42-Phaeocystis_antarctica.AAC.2